MNDMRDYRCYCGRTKAYGGLPPARCWACLDCGSGLSVNGGRYITYPHEFKIFPDKETRCKYCFGKYTDIFPPEDD